jgi:hypothetical protein
LAQPTFRRFWVKVLPDGLAVPQFEPDTGRERLWKEYQGPVNRVLFLSISEPLAAKIQSHGNLAKTVNLPALEFPVQARVDYFRHNTIRYIPHQVCGFCTVEFDLPGESDLICPCCLARNAWYCDICDTLKEVPLIVGQEARCPDCQAVRRIRGLLRLECIGEYFEEKHHYVHVLDLDGSRHLIIDSLPQK